MPRVFLVLLLAVGTFTARADDKPSPAVKQILDEAVAEVKKNREALQKANQRPLEDARDELQEWASKLVDQGKAEEAGAVLKQVGTLAEDVGRMTTGGVTPSLSPSVKRVMDKAVKAVKKNREAFDRSNATPLANARSRLEDLAKTLITANKAEEAGKTLQQVKTLERDVMSMAEAPAPPKPDPVPPQRPTPVQADAVAWNGHQYKVFKEKLSWHDAKKRCEELGGHLVVINDEREQAFVVELLGRNGMPVDARRNRNWKGVWLGATDEAKEGDWKWVDGSALGYTKWSPTEPDNLYGKSHYLFLFIHYGGEWNDALDTTPHAEGFVCEWDR